MSKAQHDVQNLSLSIADKVFLKKLVQTSVLSYFQGNKELDHTTVPVPKSALLKKELGAFVTLSKQGTLRGCIGNVIGQGPLYLTVARMARAAAFADPRFPPVSQEEFEKLEIEISIMGPITLCSDPEKIELGRHGLLIRRGASSGLLLPQVATELGWTREQFLDQTCVKAGLHPQIWKEKGTQIYWFEAYVF